MSATATALQTQLMLLVEDHGLEVVANAFGTIRAVPPAPRSERKSVRYAVSYEGELITETERAVLWWIPAGGEPDASSGQATWIPRVLVIEMRAREEDKLGSVRITKPIEWRYARRCGKSIEFLRGVRS